MSVQSCVNIPFVGTQQFEVPWGSTVNTFSRFAKGLGFTWHLHVCKRSFLPIYGANRDGGNNRIFNFLPSTQANVNALVRIFQSVFEISLDIMNDTAVSNGSYQTENNPDYGIYIANKIAAEQCMQDRYYEIINKVFQYFTLHGATPNNIATWTDIHNLLIPTLQRESDKQLIIPAGIWAFDPGSAANVALEAWHTADATFGDGSGLFGIETINT